MVTIFGFSPHHSYYCSGFTLWWVFVSGSTVLNMYPLILAWDVIMLNDVGLMSSWLLAIRVGLALIRLGGVNLVFLTVSPKFIASFPMLLNPVPNSELELLLSLWHFFDLAPCFLITFSSFSNFLLNCTKEFFLGLGFVPPFLVAWKLAFCNLSFSYLWQSFMLWLVYYALPACSLQKLQCFSKQTFFGTLAVDSVPGLLLLFLLLLEAFLGSLKETALLGLEFLGGRVSPRCKGHPSSWYCTTVH